MGNRNEKSKWIDINEKAVATSYTASQKCMYGDDNFLPIVKDMNHFKILTTFNSYLCEDKFKNQSHKPTLLAVPLSASNRINFAINRALLTV